MKAFLASLITFVLGVIIMTPIEAHHQAKINAEIEASRREAALFQARIARGLGG